MFAKSMVATFPKQQGLLMLDLTQKTDGFDFAIFMVDLRQYNYVPRTVAQYYSKCVM